MQDDFERFNLIQPEIPLDDLFTRDLAEMANGSELEPHLSHHPQPILFRPNNSAVITRARKKPAHSHSTLYQIVSTTQPATDIAALCTLSIMSAFIRVARGVRAAPIRPAVQPLVARSAVAHFTTSMPRRSEHAEETFEEFSARFEKEFDGVQDIFELQRNLNNAFAYDLVPAPSVIAAALKAARRVNDFGTAVRIFEGIKTKVENKGQYEQYLEELKPLREELGVPLKEELYPEEK
ncbi:hypothetical protein FSARC_12460 [Fusarium sarcochroum]|uniref:Cytochrome c oxidase subunit 6, mitochondrial n=1 Tax=Fusarium sarcochroum TaxID=1208366 RepID=A0A8H4T8E2_9HYPO|nr:hypothetical protein FSARC_12460 [Fusarium sarcochroum]